ncbi:type III-B CRISPR-associated protein Cas10/Cmr2 [Thermogemmatispora tikiterensis]|nr:type III-B CRISPR-associated protein Cas10/Cmr2 [Thermogemmatispora tikiterensis]
MTPSYMLIFTLGPVQSFIAQARKARDLWLGSFLLSRLMEAALKDVPSKTLVFPTNPSIDRQRWIPDLPNRYVAIFSTTQEMPNPQTKALQTAEQSQKAIHQAWEEICREVYQQLFGSNGADWASNEVLRAIWERQIKPENLFEIYWVIVANTNGQGAPLGYGSWFKRAAQALDARKSLRDFKAQDEPGEKSTLSGEREALHTQGASRQEVRAFWTQVANKPGISAKDLAPDGSERLDAIDTVKRFALLSKSFLSGPGDGSEAPKQGLDFPSTSTMAAATFIEQLLLPQQSRSAASREIQEAAKRWQEITAPLKREKPHLALPYLEQKAQQANYSWLKDVDGECAFVETFTAQRLRTNYRALVEPRLQRFPWEWVIEEPTYLDRAHQVLRELHRLLGEPTPYYALLQMDGDQMGTIIGEVQSQDDHRTISRALSEFARTHVPGIVEDKRPGKLIYAGGDDVLAFAPLAHMFAMASALQQTYRKIVGSSVQTVSKGTRTATVSMGIAVAHHLMPLTLVRRMAREAEEQAKQRYGRNALVVTILWRSGNTLSAGCRWNYPPQDHEQQAGEATTEPFEIFKGVVQLFARGTLSPRCLEILKRELPGLEGLPPKARSSEIGRILARQWNVSTAHQPPETGPEALADALVRLAALMEKSHPGAFSGPDSSGLKEVLNWLQILAFLVREAGNNVSFY